MRAFLPGQSRASFRNPGFGLEAMLCAAPNGVPVWQRAALRQGWQVCGCSAVCVILQDWQDRRDVAQIGDIPETGDPRWGLFRLSVKSYAKGLNSHLDRRICIA